jgi:thioredoxin
MTDLDFFEKLHQSQQPVVVDFWAPWCGPCKMVDPLLKKLASEYEGRVELWKINADEQPEVLRQLKIYGIPTLVGFKDGQEVARQSGAARFSDLADIFEAALSGERPQPVEIPLTLFDRFLRIAIGFALMYLAYIRDFQGIFLLIAAGGLVALFTAVHDRCPVWQAIKPRLKSLFKTGAST